MPAPKDPIAYALWKQRMSESRKGEKNHNYGKPVSEDRKEKQSNSMKGRYAGEKNPMYGVHLTGEQNPFYGKTHTEEAKAKISAANCGKTVWTSGIPSSWLGHLNKPRTDAVKQKISKSHKGTPKSDKFKEKMREIKLNTSKTGEDSHRWKGGITKLNLHIRTLPRYKLACEDAMKHSNYTDTFTGVHGHLLACHHKIPQNVIIRQYNIKNIDDARKCDLLFDPSNLIVMLASAHDKFHNIYGDDKNIYELTPEELKELYQ